MGHRIRIWAPAKVNLHLGVGSRRPDGYHDVVTVLHTLELADEVVVSAADSLSLVCEPEVVLPAEENLAWRAGIAAGEAFDREPGLEIALRKRIPARAGLGGGSSDAAAVLRAAARLWGAPLEDPRLAEAAHRLGADVAFLVEGGAALYGGRGEVLVRRLPPLDAHAVLVRPDAEIPTPDAYRAFDALPGSPSPESPDALIAAMRLGRPARVAAHLHNDLTPASLSLVPQIGEVLEELGSAPGVLGAVMAGSGSAVLGLCDTAETAASVAEEMAFKGYWSLATRFSSGTNERLEASE